MDIVETINDLRSVLAAERRLDRTVGLVPTMGFLHRGHVSLMERSVADNDRTVATIFVNRLQFASGEDLSTYPRDPDGDRAQAEAAGVDFLFMPAEEEMYPEPMATTVSVDVAKGLMESAARPTHFDGVATVVAKLFDIIGPCRSYFGEKDFQQLAVVRRMVADLNQPVDVVGCPIVREDDGLAMSSRNAYLTPEERSVAGRLHQALQTAVAAIGAGERSAPVIRQLMADHIAVEPRFEPDYAEVVDAHSLERLNPVVGEVRLLVAARLGVPRLLDNLGCTAGAAG